MLFPISDLISGTSACITVEQCQLLTYQSGLNPGPSTPSKYLHWNRTASTQVAVETMSDRASQSFGEEKLRLQREHARLEQMQRSLESERAVMTESVTAEAKKLEDMRLQRVHEHKLFVEEMQVGF